MTYDIGLAPLDWHTMLSLAAMGLVSVVIACWATYELNAGDLVDPRVIELDATQSRTPSVRGMATFGPGRLSLIFKSKPSLARKSLAIDSTEQSLEMTTMYSTLGQLSDDGTNGLLSGVLPDTGKHRFRGQKFLAPGLSYPSRSASTSSTRLKDKKVVLVHEVEVTQNHEQEQKDRDRRILQNLKGKDKS